MMYQNTETIWSRTALLRRREPLPKDRTAEVVVIGAGMAGILTAYYLKKQGKEVIVIEADRIGGGQTKNSTAKITSQHGCIYSELEERFSTVDAELYARANQDAIIRYENLIEEEGIHCHFERVDSFLYSRKDALFLRKEAEAAGRAGIPAYFTKTTPLPFAIGGAVCFEEQAQFHPLEFLGQLSERVTVYEHTKVLKVHDRIVETDHGKIETEHIVFATHVPLPKVPGFYSIRQHREESCVLALSGVKRWDGMAHSADEDGLSFRWFEDYLLVSSTGRRIGKLEAVGEAAERHRGKTDAGGAYAELAGRIGKLFPESRIEAAWMAQDYMPHDNLSFIGHFSRLRPNWYVITGLKKWGMTTALIGARMIRDEICGVMSPYVYLYTPQRFYYRAAKENFWEDLKVSASELARGIFSASMKKDVP